MENMSRSLLTRELAIDETCSSDRGVCAWSTRAATQHEDAGCAVDYVVLREGRPVAGVQVKPDSVSSRPDVLRMNERKQTTFGLPVHTHIYSVCRLSFDEGDTATIARHVRAASVLLAARALPMISDTVDDATNGSTDDAGDNANGAIDKSNGNSPHRNILGPSFW